MSGLTQMLACPFWSLNLSPSRFLFCQCPCILVRFAAISKPSLTSPLIARLISMYFKHRELDQLLASGSPLDRQSFHKILALGLFDIFISFPIAILNILLAVLQDGGTPAFYPGWRAIHSEFSVIQSVSSDDWKSAGFWTIFLIRYDQWVNPLFAIVFFTLFGLTEKNRLWYRDLFWKTFKPLGLRPRSKPEVSQIVFGSKPAPESALSGLCTTQT